MKSDFAWAGGWARRRGLQQPSGTETDTSGHRFGHRCPRTSGMVAVSQRPTTLGAALHLAYRACKRTAQLARSCRL